MFLGPYEEYGVLMKIRTSGPRKQPIAFLLCLPPYGGKLWLYGWVSSRWPEVQPFSFGPKCKKGESKNETKK